MAILSLGNQHPSEIDTPPPSLAPPPDNPWNVGGVLSGDRVPPTYVYTQRREPHMGPSYLMVPWDNFETMYDLHVYPQDAPDPVRQSDFYAAGNKIHPWAQMQIQTNLALGSIAAVMEDTFHIGKLLGYWHRPMYAGMQKPSIPRSNIQEPVPTTYGSLYEVRPHLPSGILETATGFAQPVTEFNDGYPY
jgi:hypothetical protein